MSRPRRRPRPQVGSFDAAPHVVASAAVLASSCWWHTLDQPEHFADSRLLASVGWTHQAHALAEDHPGELLDALSRHFEVAHSEREAATWRRNTARFVARSSAGPLLPAV